MSLNGIKKVRVVIDGNEHLFPVGMTIFEAAESVGIEIPHYCYHPGLPIAGACRMCLVEIEKIPKLQISCYMTVGDGMVIRTNTERVKRARAAMLEFHLVNHPLDCPVCDQAGECGLQIYYMTHGLYISRLLENKVKKTKKAAQIGPHVMLDQERCILCSRCVRFCAEISKSHELGIFERGDYSELDIFPGKQLDNPYSGNVVDICPVGALTDRDFRFKTRVWYLEEAESVCPRCANGCNIYIHYNLKRPYKNDGRRISRLKPRYNSEVNDWWICDEGRYCFKFADNDDRLLEPLVRQDSRTARPGWEETLGRAAERLRATAAAAKVEVAVLVSPQASNEELHITKRIFNEQLPGCGFYFSALSPFEPTEDSLLRKKDKNPNTRGAELMGLSSDSAGVKSLAELKSAALAGKIGALFIAYHDPPGLPESENRGWAEAIERIPLIIYQGTNNTATSRSAHIVLPAATFAEREGTVTNSSSRVQIQRRAFSPAGEALPGWEIMRCLGEALGGVYRFENAEQVFDDMAQKYPAFAGLDYGKIGSSGIIVTSGK
ncbi:MAG TPA: molybdopterin-dependent oxidoreductase [archaeon]|nr:molybdopterin-dependent oxidoreductase [archaeon]